MKPLIFSLLLSLMGVVWICSAEEEGSQSPKTSNTSEILIAAERTEKYFDRLKGKRIGLVGNHSSRIGKKHLVDSLLSAGFQLVKIFGPEHGFRGKASAGEKVEDGRDPRTGLPVLSLYGKDKKPRPDQMDDLDVMLFDIQDVGVRFYTYISTLHYIMEACAQSSIPLIVLDRPNPNGHYIDGPVLDTAFSSFVGMHPVPVVYGMTIGEYARMINGEGWLKSGVQCNLSVVPCAHYKHDKRYRVPVAPSPNLPTERSILLYPSLCFFEGTIVSVGRGTDQPFSCFGHPDLDGPYSFTPMSNTASISPKLEGILCRGYDLSNIPVENIRSWKGLELQWLISSYTSLKEKHSFFNRSEFFDQLAGSDQLRKQIKSGYSAKEIRQSWTDDLDTFESIRAKYLIYQ